MIVDAGGCTLVTSSYEVISSSPLRIKEITASDCASTHFLLYLTLIYILNHRSISRFCFR